MENKKIFAILTLVVGVILVLLLISYASEKETSIPQTPEQQTEDQTVTTEERAAKLEELSNLEEVRAVFSQASSTEVSSDRSGEVVLSLEEGQMVPTAYELYVNFDPSLISVEEVVTGGLWGGEQVLSKEIDNDTGRIHVSVGQGFETEATGSRELARVRFRINEGVNPNEISFSLGDESKTYHIYEGVTQSVPVESLPFTIEISN